jgi:two-component system chemotaxis response regulator CheB
MNRIFIVDDSAFVRRALTRILAGERGFRVVGEAGSGPEALARIPAADPDFVTLDIEMPGMDGLQVLPALLRWKPTLRVLMLSAHTREGATATVAALAAGAVDFIDKSALNVMDLEVLKREVVDRLEALRPIPGRRNGAAASAPPLTGSTLSRMAVTAMPELRDCELCVIGASTGGPAAIQQIVEALPARFPLAMVVVQHMPPGFTDAFARRLDPLCRLRVMEAVEGQRLAPGTVVIAPGGRHLRVSPGLAVVLSPEPADARHIPSIDVTMRSAARSRAGRVLGILLTGMGEDGAEGMATIRAGGGITIAESEASCVVYGMPRAAIRRGGATWVMRLGEIVGVLGTLSS